MKLIERLSYRCYQLYITLCRGAGLYIITGNMVLGFIHCETVHVVGVICMEPRGLKSYLFS